MGELRVDHTDRTDTAVAGVFLGEPQGHAIRVGHELSSRLRLPVRQHGQTGILCTPSLF